MRRILNRIIFIFSLLGLSVSAFLFYEYNLAGSVACPIGQGCEIVRTSPYSNFLGISIPVWGLFFYFLLAFFSVFRLFKLQFLFALGGFAFGVYLTFLEAFVIGAFCFWCVLSFIIVCSGYPRVFNPRLQSSGRDVLDFKRERLKVVSSM